MKPYCDLLPGGKYGNFFQDMQDLYYYMLMLTNGDSLDDRIVSTYDNICLQHFSIPNLFLGARCCLMDMLWHSLCMEWEFFETEIMT